MFCHFKNFISNNVTAPYNTNANGFFKILDADKNGTLSKAEFADLPVKMVTG